jgi:hypothetical protein
MRKWLVCFVAVVLVCIAAASAATAAPLPVIYNGAYGFAHASPTASPPGSNDFSCKPTAAHPRPVILVHGTFEDMSDNWQALSPLLYNNGYCVFALNYGAYNGSGSRSASTEPARSKTPRVSFPASSTASSPRPERARSISSATRRAG